MLDAFIYDFGYAWPWRYGHFIAGIVFAMLALAGWRMRRRLLITSAAALLAGWALTGSYIVHHVLRFNRPAELPTAQFLVAGSGRVLDLGAGSGRSSIMVLRARPGASLTALDLYSGYFGIVRNSPDRLMANAKIAGVADRVTVKVGDMRRIPLADATYDAVISVAAIDHLRQKDIVTTLGEAARVLRPRGELLLVNLSGDGWMLTAFPWMRLHRPFGRPADAGRWRTMIETAGFEIVEQGTRPATLYFVARRAIRAR